MNVAIYTLVVSFLGVSTLVGIGGIVFIVASGHEVPPALASAVGATIGALVGLLSRPPGNDPEVRDGGKGRT